jgi:hypothetical protein
LEIFSSNRTAGNAVSNGEEDDGIVEFQQAAEKQRVA